MYRLIYFLLVGVILNMGCSRIPTVSVNDDPQYSERTYAISHGSREIEWQVYTGGINKGIIVHRARWNGPVHESVPWMKKILGRILQDLKKQDLHTFMLGRLRHTFGKDNTEISERLMVAAKKSAQWDTTKGAPLSGHETGFVSELCNAYDVHMELKEVFAEYGMSLQMSRAEKVLIDKVKRLPDSADILKKYPVLNAEDRLPYDCITWLTISSN